MTPPRNSKVAFIVIGVLVTVVIMLLLMKIDPAVTLFTFNDAPPPPICEAINALIARCVGTILSLSAVKNGSV